MTTKKLDDEEIDAIIDEHMRNYRALEASGGPTGMRIIGGGINAVWAAREYFRAGWKVTLLEKRPKYTRWNNIYIFLRTCYKQRAWLGRVFTNVFEGKPSATREAIFEPTLLTCSSSIRALEKAGKRRMLMVIERMNVTHPGAHDHFLFVTGAEFVQFKFPDSKNSFFSAVFKAPSGGLELNGKAGANPSTLPGYGRIENGGQHFRLMGQVFGCGTGTNDVNCVQTYLGRREL